MKLLLGILGGVVAGGVGAYIVGFSKGYQQANIAAGRAPALKGSLLGIVH